MSITNPTGYITAGDKKLAVNNVTINWTTNKLPNMSKVFSVSRFLGINIAEIIAKMSVQNIELLAEYISQVEHPKPVIPKYQCLNGYVRQPKRRSQRRLAVYTKKYQ